MRRTFPEAVAMCVAATYVEAEDLAEQVIVDGLDLPALVDMEAALHALADLSSNRIDVSRRAEPITALRAAVVAVMLAVAPAAAAPSRT
jgi:hypothetical protein